MKHIARLLKRSLTLPLAAWAWAVSLSLPAAAQPWSPHSPLAQGSWQKVSVTQTGMYRLTRGDLAAMGFGEPAKVRVYGLGGRQLSYMPGKDKRENLVMLPAVHDANGLLFYAQGPDGWDYIETENAFAPNINHYSRKAYYYVTTGEADDAPQACHKPEGEANASITDYDNRYYHASPEEQPDKGGREWVGDRCSVDTASLVLPVGLTILPGAKVKGLLKTCATLAYKEAYDVLLDGSQVAHPTFDAMEKSQSTSKVTFEANPGGGAVGNVELRYNFLSLSQYAYLAYLSLTARAPLSFTGLSLPFRSSRQSNALTPVTFRLADLPESARIWNVTDVAQPTEVAYERRGSQACFDAPPLQLDEYIAFDPAAEFPQPTREGAVANLDHHADEPVNYLVLTVADFQPHAQRLVDLHKATRNLSGRVVLVDELYEEFGGGQPSAMALRNYLKMLYERGAGTANELRYVLLFGEGSHNNYDRLSKTNRVPTYQAAESYGVSDNYAADSFYAWLTDGQGGDDERWDVPSSTTDEPAIKAAVNVGVGRLPASTLEEAERGVTKIENYVLKPEAGSWQQRAVFLACIGNQNEHINYANRQATALEEEQPEMLCQRLFSDAYLAETDVNGTFFPECSRLLKAAMQAGVGLLHYTGHGYHSVIADNLMGVEFLGSICNDGRLAVLCGATCNLWDFDQNHVGISSSGFFNPYGGLIASFSACRQTYGSYNYEATRQFIKSLYGNAPDGTPNALGDAARDSKNKATRQGTTNLCFNLLGDPAVVPHFPRQYYVSVESVQGVPFANVSEPIHALQPTAIECAIRNLASGDIVTDFNGSAEATLYDKRTEHRTLGQGDGDPMTYSEWTSRLFKGTVTVSNGRFGLSFQLPRDFDTSVGFGRLSTYGVSTDGREAMGSDELLVGGLPETLPTDTIGPSVQCYVDYPRDADGNIAEGAPVLYVELDDASGINASGLGVGHNLQLVLDGVRLDPVNLGESFVYEQGSATTGRVAYQMYGVALTRHTLTVKAWDCMNNSTEREFVVDLTPGQNRIGVVDANDGRIQGQFHITINSDLVGGEAWASVRVYAADGRMVVAHEGPYLQRNGQFDIDAIPAAKNLASGVYVARVKVTSNGRKTAFSRKFIVNAQ